GTPWRAAGARTVARAQRRAAQPVRRSPLRAASRPPSRRRGSHPRSPSSFRFPPDRNAALAGDGVELGAPAVRAEPLEHSLDERLVARWDAGGELALGARVELRRPARAGAGPTAAALEGDRDETLLGELVQVVGGERAADAGGRGGVVARDGPPGAGDVLVEP